MAEDVPVGMFTIPLPETKWTMASSFGLSSDAFSSLSDVSEESRSLPYVRLLSVEVKGRDASLSGYGSFRNLIK